MGSHEYTLENMDELDQHAKDIENSDIERELKETQPSYKKSGPKPKYKTEEERIEARRARARARYQQEKLKPITEEERIKLSKLRTERAMKWHNNNKEKRKEMNRKYASKTKKLTKLEKLANSGQLPESTLSILKDMNII